MENFSLATVNYSVANSSAPIQLPLGAVAFAPFIFLELVAAVVSNAILLALVILACGLKFNNNINIYLFSLSLTGFLGAFSTFCLLTVVVARRWVLGSIMCALNRSAINVSNLLYLILYLIISGDKYKMVRDSFLSRPTKKRSYFISVAVWLVAAGFGALTFGGSFIDLPNSDSEAEKENFICFGLSTERVSDTDSFIVASILIAGFWFFSAIISGVSFSNFVRVLVKLRNLKKLRLRFAEQSRRDQVVRINGRDKPLYCTGEERTAKSLALIYFIQFFSITISYGMAYTQIIRNFTLPPENQDGRNFQIYFIVLLIAQLFPTTNPVYLILANKRLRMRVKGLFKCELNPELEDSPNHHAIEAAKGRARSTALVKLHTHSRVIPQNEHIEQ